MRLSSFRDFSPHGGCTEAVVSALGKAKLSVYVAAYSFTSTGIAKALLDAKKRGVKVSVILDKSNETQQYTEASFLENSGLSPLIDHKHAIFYNKFILIDGSTLITGSFNFTKAAEEHNGENMLVIQDAKLCGKYLANWKEHEGHCQKYHRTK
jgi:phosphatidylserine/phosphatidylglycerophosphate/cardiolipin synthase-like enzyme